MLWVIPLTSDTSKCLFQFPPQSPSPFPFSLPQPFSLTRIIIDLSARPPATPDLRPTVSSLLFPTPRPHEPNFHSHQLLPTLLLRAPPAEP